ncbi:hypothetical protein J6590_014196 [Homalodisca vitripennis]|nr:hypothetical protein J6590_014196 [Homalodisca vitripennis]
MGVFEHFHLDDEMGKSTSEEARAGKDRNYPDGKHRSRLTARQESSFHLSAIFYTLPGRCRLTDRLAFVVGRRLTAGSCVLEGLLPQQVTQETPGLPGNLRFICKVEVIEGLTEASRGRGNGNLRQPLASLLATAGGRGGNEPSVIFSAKELATQQLKQKVIILRAAQTKNVKLSAPLIIVLVEQATWQGPVALKKEPMET